MSISMLYKDNVISIVSYSPNQSTDHQINIYGLIFFSTPLKQFLNIFVVLSGGAISK
jgi:hypothetical protein